jgi:spermidine/putrescine transport system permease protein
VIRHGRPWGLYAYAAAFLVFLYGPIALLPIFSVNDSTQIAFPLHGLTLRWYRELAGDEQLFAALARSLSVASTVAALTTTLGIAAGWALRGRRLRGSRSFMGVLLLPLVIPGLIMGVSLLVLAGQAGITPSLLTVGAGHLVLCLPYSLLVMMTRFEGNDGALEEASRDLGVGPAATFFRIVLPMALPAVISSVLMTFTISFDEFVLSFFLSGSSTTLPVYLWAQLRFPEKLPGVMALATLILMVSGTLIVCAEWLRGLGGGAARRFRP